MSMPSEVMDQSRERPDTKLSLFGCLDVVDRHRTGVCVAGFGIADGVAHGESLPNGNAL